MKPRELGPYLLLRKLSEDALCETYRAGQHTEQEVERVVLLYLFANDPQNALWIAETAQAGRRALAGLESSCLWPAIDSGEVGGIAYLTYDYMPGRSLQTVLERSRQQEHPLPIEHALLITDRVAHGLLAAWEHESRMLHGFVVPHLVMLSNEGDVQLLGLEVASRLRKLLTDPAVREEMGVYLAPEVVPEGQPATTDDVFSLGALLYRLVTGKPLPPSSAGGAESLVQEATTVDGSPLPDAVAKLLRGSLAPYSSRTNLKAWHTQLGGLLASGEYDVNAFNLALFLHTLFADEIEQDTQEGEEALDSEPATDIERAIAELAPVIGIETDDATEPTSDGRPEGISVDSVDEPSVEPGRRGKTLGIAAGVAALVLASYGAYSLFGPSDTPQMDLTNTRPQMTSPAASGPAAAAPAEDAEAVDDLLEATGEETLGMSPDEIDQRVQELLSQRSADMESSLRSEFESELADLRRELEAAREKAANQPAEVVEAPTTADAQDESRAPTYPTTGPDDESRGATPAGGSPNETSPANATADLPHTDAADPVADDLIETSNIDLPALQSADAAETASAQSPPPKQDVPERHAAQPTVTEHPVSQPPVGEPPTTETTVSEPPRPVPQRAQDTAPQNSATRDTEADAAEPVAQASDLTTPGPGVFSPKILHAAQPVYPMMARRLKKKALVTVRVLVDENGRVLEAERLGDEAGYGFDEAAVQAARKSEWQPATKDGVPVKMWSTVRIAFEP